MDSKICYGLRPVDSADFVKVDGYIVDKNVLDDYNKLKERKFKLIEIKNLI